MVDLSELFLDAIMTVRAFMPSRITTIPRRFAFPLHLQSFTNVGPNVTVQITDEDRRAVLGCDGTVSSRSANANSEARIMYSPAISSSVHQLRSYWLEPFDDR